jgi:hypothetical protein
MPGENELRAAIRSELASLLNQTRDDCVHVETRMTHEMHKRITHFIQSVYVVFVFIWLILIISNSFYESVAAYVLLIPFGAFLFGFMHAEEVCHSEVENDVFSVTFIALGILFSIPLLTLFNKDNINPKLNHTIFLALFLILLAYIPLWVPYHYRHVCRAIRSCLETMSAVLYMYAITIFFMEV